MKNQISLLMFLVLSFTGFNAVHAIAEEEILGIWLNLAGDGQIEISKQGENYIGTIIGSTNPDSPDRKDINNADPALRDRSLLNIQIFGDLTYRDENKWNGGWIYDPNNGKTYKCKMTLKDSNTIEIRGYIGVSLFGRSEEWKRKTTDEEN